MNFKKNLEAREEDFFLFQLISLKCGTNFEKTNKKKKNRRGGKHLSVLRVRIYLIRFIHVFGLNFVIFKNYLRLYFMQNTQV